MRATAALIGVGLGAVAALGAGAGCSEHPDADYQAFLDRADRRTPDGGLSFQSRLEDLTGEWLVHSLLAGGLDLGLRMRFVMDPARSPIDLSAEVWLSTAAPGDPPLLETTTTVGPDGRFLLLAEPLVLGPPALKVDSPVTANVLMDNLTLGPDAWCGTATGSVTSPLSLDLKGTTLGARRDDQRSLSLEEVPRSCGGDSPAGGSGGGGGPRPPTPDLSGVASQLADLSGDWLLRIKLAGGLPLELQASLRFTPASPSDGGADGGLGGGSLDGALRRAVDPPGTPALHTFSTAVSTDGRFEVWIPDLQLSNVSGSILLVGATLSADGFCGAAAGQVSQPFDLDLAGSTFGAVRWPAGTPAPTGAPESCP